MILTTEGDSQAIAARCLECGESFSLLLTLLMNPDTADSYQTTLPLLQHEWGRLRVWAGNTAAHRRGRVSLDYRLREATHMRQRAIDLLDDLNSSLQEGE